MPTVKEPSYFVKGVKIPPMFKAHKEAGGVFELDAYLELFNAARPDQIMGEASTIYFQCPQRVIENLKNHDIDPESIKLIILLRNPIERALSGYMMQHQAGIDKRSFDEAMRYESIFLKFGFEWDPSDYIEFMKAAERLRYCLKNFPHCKIVLLEDLKTNPRKTMNELFGFLGVESSFHVNLSTSFNITGKPRCKALDNILRKPSPLKKLLPGLERLIPYEKKRRFIEYLISMNTRERHQLTTEQRCFLQEKFADDIEELGGIVGRDLSHWLGTSAERQSHPG